ncbi:meiosis 1 arrest protein-like [Diadema setosum]|uniref:meiosis 1 arrest protein-like n=1 Tax=Diadema setosum TaxID=31175 RepID=UPI003B3BBD89
MDKQNQMVRSVFTRQPARIVLVDYSPPFSAEICQTLYQVLEHTLSLVCSMTGPCRVPFFGLFALGAHSENLFPLQHVRGNFPRLQNALQELRSYQKQATAVTESGSRNHLPQALQDAVAQFKRQSQTLRQTTSFNAQLEVIIVTSQQGAFVSRQLEKVMGEVDLECLRRIQVLSVFSPESVVLADEDPVSSQQSSSTTTSSSTSGENLLSSGVLEVIAIEPDELSFQNFFTSWFHDYSTDKEHLHILFPGAGVTSSKLVLKCDLQERLISPTLLPFQAQFQLTTAPSPVHSKPPTQGSSSTTQTVPVKRLRVIQMVKISGVCDSVIFGQPAIARATSCWKLDWEELDANQQNFHALCHLLHEKEVALLTRLDPNEVTNYPYSASSLSAIPKPRGHFLIFPSLALSLLIKPVATSELMLPGDFQPVAEKPVSDAVAMVTEYLDQLEISEKFNPLLAKSNLTPSLVSLLTRSTTSTRQPRRSRAPQPAQPAFSYTPMGRGRGRGRGPTRGPPPTQHGFQTATNLVRSPAGPSSKRFCTIPMESSVYDFEY